MHQVHNTILKSFLTDGHDPGRPHIGVACEVRDPTARKSLEDYNKGLANSSPLMPRVEEGSLCYEGLACTHYNVALRLVHEARFSPSGDLAKLKDEDPTLAETASMGHLWIVLPENLAESLKKDVCAWRNQDQNENQALTDGELVRMAKVAVDRYLSMAGAGAQVDLPLASITTAATLATPLRLNPQVMGAFCKFVCQMTAEHNSSLVNEFLDFWSANVDPRHIAIPHSFFESMAKTKALEKQGLLRLFMSMAMYCDEGSMPRPKPTPNQAGLITPKDMADLGKHAFVVDLATRALIQVWKQHKPYLSGHLPPHKVNEEVVAIGSLIVRLVFGKSLDGLPRMPGGPETWAKCTIVTGKATDEKMLKLLGWWAKHLDTRFPELKFSEVSGLTAHLPVVDLPKETDDTVFVVPAKRIVRKTHSAPAEPEATPTQKAAPLAHLAFKPGDPVTLLRRVTTTIPLADNPSFRKDVRAGAEATVVALADGADKSKVEILTEVMHKGAPMEVRAWVLCKNLALASDMSGQEQPLPDAEQPLPEHIVKGHAFGDIVERVEDWADLLDHDAPLAHLAALKGSATFAMHMVSQFVPTYSDKDLVVVNRLNKAGARRTEVWTARSFAPGELMFAPWTPEIKDRLWTSALSAHLELPREVVPGNRVLALDGRNRNLLCHANHRCQRSAAMQICSWSSPASLPLAAAWI